MDRVDRLERIRRLEAARGGTKVIAYVTSTRENLEAMMALDVVPVVYRHLVALSADTEKPKLDLFLHSNGGDGTVPWRLVNLMREFGAEFHVLVPHHAFSAATLTALGADTVVMHPMGMLGPIDPTVTTPYNPENPANPTQRLGISVEDVASYISLVRDDVGIRHEEELVKAFELLARRIHPLALGTVKRSTSQSRMLGEKLLRSRRKNDLDDHSIKELVEKLASQLFYHGHPISRREAADDIKLPFVVDAKEEVADSMWSLYEAYAEDMQLEQPFNAITEALAVTGPLELPPAPKMGGEGQYTPTDISIGHAEIGPYSGVRVESTARSDRNAISFDVVTRREWTGEIQAKISILKTGWEQDA